MAEIPRRVLADLNAGRTETVNLVEWLAVDQLRLLRVVLRELDVRPDAAFLRGAREAASAGVGTRTRGIGALLGRAHGSRGRVPERLAAHPSDVVRSWAAYAVAADGKLAFRTLLARLRPFAADRCMSTRECAWDAWRPRFRRDVRAGLAALRPWVEDKDPNVRRCAVEGTRPRGVWTEHVPELKREPSLGLPLLEPVRADPSRYVQNAVANWLNDASKSAPAFVRETTRRWSREEPGSAATAYIARRALRTLRLHSL